MINVGDKIIIKSTTSTGFDMYENDVDEEYVGKVAIVVEKFETEVTVDVLNDKGEVIDPSYCLAYDECELSDNSV